MNHQIFCKLITACKEKNRRSFYVNMVELYKNEEFPTHTNDNTAAHYCYEFGFIEGVELLLATEHPTHELNSLDQTPIHLACEYDHEELVRWHVEHNEKKEDYSVCDHRSGFTPSMFIVSNGNLSLLKLFVSKGYVDANIESRFRKNTHFTLAFQTNHFDVAIFLWKNNLQGKNGIHQKRLHGPSLLEEILALPKSYKHLIRLLSTIGAIDMLHTNIKGESPLRLCIRMTRSDFYASMVELGFARAEKRCDLEVLFAYMPPNIRNKFLYILRRKIQKNTTFVRCFLPLTTQFQPASKMFKAESALRDFNPDLNRTIASFAGVPYGRTLAYLKENLALIETFEFFQ